MIGKWHNRRMDGILRQYHDGELTGANAQRLQTHLTQCASCRATLQAWQGAEQTLLQSLPDSVVLDSRKANTMLTAALAQAQTRTMRQKQASSRRMVGACAVMCAAAGCWMLYANIGGEKQQGRSHVNLAASPPRTPGPSLAATHPAPVMPPANVSPSVIATAPNSQPIQSPHTPGIPTIHKPHKPRRVIAQVHVLHHRQRRMAREAFVSRRGHGSNREHLVALVYAAEKKFRTTQRFTAVMAPRASMLPQDAGTSAQSSHLLVTVTNAVNQETVNANRLVAVPLKVTQEKAEAPGMATAAALLTDATGTRAWKVCRVEQNGDGATTQRYALTWQNGSQPVTGFTVTTETLPLTKQEGDKK